MKKYNLSVIIPAYNVEKYIGFCLDSVLGQGIPEEEYEIICINDGSSDNTQKVIEEYVTKHSNIMLINQKNSGVSASRNAGINAAKGKYISFLDGDDFWMPQSFIQIYRYASDQNYWSQKVSPPNVLYYSGVRGCIEDFELLRERSNAKSLIVSSPESGHDFISRKEFNNGVWLYCVSREFLDKINLRFAEDKLCEDGPFTAELLLKAEKIQYFDIDVYFYVIRSNSITTTRDEDRIAKLQDGFRYAISVFSTLIKEHPNMPTKCLARIRTRRDSYVFFMLLRYLRSGNIKGFRTAVKQLKTENLYPIKNFPDDNYPGVKWKALTMLINTSSVCEVFIILRKILKS